MHIYLDECGDLGWVLDKPFGNGGSSRYLTICAISCPEKKLKILDRIVANLYKSWRIDPGYEKKGSSFNENGALWLSKKVVRVLNKNPDILVSAITTKKSKVHEHLRTSSGYLYQNMIMRCVVELLKDCDQAVIIPDKSSFKAKNAPISFSEYIKWQFKKEYNRKIRLNYKPELSHNNNKLMLVDWLCNFVWRSYEFREYKAYNHLKPYIRDGRFLFKKRFD